jgi:hypothetical protein
VGLLGCVDRGVPGVPPDLLYSVNSHRPRARTANLLQWSGTILGESRNLLFGKVICLLRYFDARRLELTYCDTDSAVLTTTSADLRSLVRPEYADQWDRIADFMFEVPDAPQHQSGRMKASFS